MPLKNKYLKYSPEITLEIFRQIWNKLMESGWEEEDSATMDKAFLQFKSAYPYLKDRDNKKFNTSTNTKAENIKLDKISVQEILGYDPYSVKDWNKVSEEELLTEARKRYPIGSSVRCLCNKNTRIILDNSQNFTSGNYIMFKTKEGGAIVFDEKNRWGEIISLPENKVENKVSEYVECIKCATAGTKVGEIFQCKFENNRFKWFYNKPNGAYTGWNTWGSKSNDKFHEHFKPSTKEAFDAQNQPKQPLKQAVHCKTQEEWDFITEKLDYKWTGRAGFNMLKQNSCIELSEPTYGSVQGYKSNQILSFQEWCDLNGYKMEKECKFEVGKWYKFNGGISKFHHLEDYKFWGENISLTTGFTDKHGWLDLNNASLGTPIKLSSTEVQQCLPEGHKDKIKTDTFKIGDWVCNITHPTKYIGQITKIDCDLVYYDEKDRKSDIRHATTKEVEEYLIKTKNDSKFPKCGCTKKNAEIVNFLAISRTEYDSSVGKENSPIHDYVSWNDQKYWFTTHVLQNPNKPLYEKNDILNLIRNENVTNSNSTLLRVEEGYEHENAISISNMFTHIQNYTGITPQMMSHPRGIVPPITINREEDPVESKILLHLEDSLQMVNAIKTNTITTFLI